MENLTRTIFSETSTVNNPYLESRLFKTTFVKKPKNFLGQQVEEQVIGEGQVRATESETEQQDFSLYPQRKQQTPDSQILPLSQDWS